MVTHLQPRQRKVLSGSQLRITWIGLITGDRPVALLRQGAAVTEFDGYQDIPGLVRRGSDWLVDLGVIQAESIDLGLRIAAPGVRAVALSDLNSDFGVEHAGLDLDVLVEDYVLMRIGREGSGWSALALDGEDRDPLFDGGESIVVAVDRSASMLSWYQNGAVDYAVSAILAEARRAEIAAIRLVLPGPTAEPGEVRIMATDGSAGSVEDMVAQDLRWTTGSDVVGAAAVAGRQSAGQDKLTIIITDSPPVDRLTELAETSQIVVALLGPDDLRDGFDVEYWEEVRAQGAVVVPIGDATLASVSIGRLSAALSG